MSELEGRSARSDVLTKPGSKIGLIQLSAGERENQCDDLFLRGFNAEAVQPEEEIHGLEGDALVPVNEGMVVGETESIGCSKGRKIRVRVVVKPVSRTFDGRLQETPVPESKGPAVSLDLIRMDGEDVYESEPTGFDHFASSRMALR
jgi:hypothetical protein